LYDAVLGPEGHGQVAHLEQAHASSLMRGSSAA
jgi:hypothetical protein